MATREFLLYDTLTKRVKPLTTLEPGHLRYYTCGPTVYSYAHIGNFRSFLTADLIVRTARAIGWKVTWVSNITDVGHLTLDDVADAEGEDKMERALRSKEGEQFHNIWELAEFYDQAYREDWARLNLTEPEVRPKATQHVRDQILAAEELVRKGYAYETPTGVYFSVAAFPRYGALSGNTQEALRSGTREVVQDDNKRDPADFAIWKKDAGHLMQWYSPYGWGFPGWHIECSVMARDYLGDTLDLHSGGEDNIFPHHECEIAQSEALTGKTFANHWVHTRFLQVNGEKMSKSLGNYHTVRSLAGEDPVDMLALRWALISGAFGKPLNFTDQSLSDARLNVERMRRAREIADNGQGEGADPFVGELDRLAEAMLNNLNTPVALAKALEGARLIIRYGENLTKLGGDGARNFLKRVNDLLGVVDHLPHHGHTLRLDNVKAEAEEGVVDTLYIEERIAERHAAKAARDYARADAIRAELAEKGISLMDHVSGETTWTLS
ncbi:MAG: cysteine--tRNA ligase [Armatimonadota bacterium]